MVPVSEVRDEMIAWGGATGGCREGGRGFLRVKMDEVTRRASVIWGFGPVREAASAEEA